MNLKLTRRQILVTHLNLILILVFLLESYKASRGTSTSDVFDGKTFPSTTINFTSNNKQENVDMEGHISINNEYSTTEKTNEIEEDVSMYKGGIKITNTEKSTETAVERFTFSFD